MTILSADTFTRPDQVGLGTASNGETWARDAGIGVSNIASNQGKIGPGGGDSQFLIGSQTAATVNVLCRIKSGDAGNVAAVLFRYNTSGGTNGYRAGIFGGNLVCDKYVAGSRSNIGNTSVGYNVGEEWFVRAIASGTSITVAAWKDGTSEPGPQLNLTDSSTTTAGQYGISVFMSNDFTYFDSLTITDNQSIVTSTRTISPVTAALKTTSTRTAAQTVALKVTSTRTVSETAALKMTSTRTVPETAAIKTTSTRTVPETAALKVTASRTISEAVAIKTTATRTVGATTALQSTRTRTVTDTVALLVTSTRSVPDSASLKVTKSRTVPATAAIASTKTRTVPATAALAAIRIVPCTVSLSGDITGMHITFTARSGSITFTARSGNITMFV